MPLKQLKQLVIHGQSPFPLQVREPRQLERSREQVVVGTDVWDDWGSQSDVLVVWLMNGNGQAELLELRLTLIGWPEVLWKRTIWGGLLDKLLPQRSPWKLKSALGEDSVLD